MEQLNEFGIALIQSIQTLSPALDGIMKLFTFMGTVEFYLILLPLIFWNISPAAGFRTLLLLAVTDTVSTSFKLLLRQPRPYWISDRVQGLSDEFTYGAPSSHASDSLAVWGYLAYTVRTTWAYLAAGLLVLLISFSRLYLGVHFPQDLLAGWIIGLIALAAFISLDRPVSRRLEGRSTGTLIGIGFGASMAIVTAGILIKALAGGNADPEILEYQSEAGSLEPFINLSGALFGAIAGYVLMKSRANFSPAGTAGVLLTRYLVGMAGIILVWLGLDLVFGLIAADETILGMALRYLRYAAAPLWAFFGAPWLFLRFNLAGPASLNET